MKRSKHSLSHYRLLSMDMGLLIPCGWFEVLPGDTIQHATSALVRAAPLVSPMMHPVSVRIHHWYVPYRLIWDNFQSFITGGPTGMDATVFPTFSIGAGGVVGSLHDHLGIPPMGGAPAITVSALPNRAYNLIWNENYRDEDLQTAALISKGDGNDATTEGTLRPISWEKDYFTSARPWEQKGPAVTLPLGQLAPVIPTTANAPINLKNVTGGTSGVMRSVPASGALSINTPPGANSDVTLGSPSGMSADLSNATAATINQLRNAFAIQRFEEARARYGSRYTEYLRYLGVRSSDARLQRPEYLGGGRQTIQVSEVLQTGPSAAPDQANVVGALKGHGIGAMRSNRYRRFIEEHGLIMSLISIRPKTMYMNMLERKWNRRLKEDFWQKELEHVGQQAIKNKEIYAAHSVPDGTFGYQDRYDEYRRCESGVAGEFRTTLAYWHLARDLASEPALNSSFITCVPPLRPFASSTTDPFYVMCNHSIQTRRLVCQTGKSYIF